MVHIVDTLKAEVIDLVAARVGKWGKGQAETAKRFARQYLLNANPKDVARLGVDPLAESILSLFVYAQARTIGQPKIRVYNPTLEEHGWVSDHTIVEILNDDMPFLVDSLTAELTRRHLNLHFLLHPILVVERDGAGALKDVLEGGEKEARLESLIHLQIDRIADSADHQAIAEGLSRILSDVRLAVTDWQAIRGRTKDVIAELDRTITGISSEEASEARDFLQWLHDDHFTYLGFRTFTFPQGTADTRGIVVQLENNLGILREAERHIFDERRSLNEMPPRVQAFIKEPSVLLIAKSAIQASVHRPVAMDIIGVKQFDDQGRVVGLSVFLGLFTSAAYTRLPAQIPLLRRKVARALERSGFRPASHDGKTLLNILDTYPRDELFQISEEALFSTALGILHLQERPRPALFVRKDEFERLVSCLVFVPRDRYDTQLRLAVQRILENAYGGSVATYSTQVGEAPLARLHFIVETALGAIPDLDPADIEARIAEAARSWQDHLTDALLHSYGEEKGLGLARKYAEAFPISYRERYGVPTAARDVGKIEHVLAEDGIALDLYHPLDAQEREIRFKLYHARRMVSLSDVLPVLENMGFRVDSEVPHLLAIPDEEGPFWIHDFGLTAYGEQSIKIAEMRDRLEDAFMNVWAGKAENDGFNRLVLCAGLSWRDAAMVRAYAKYLRQAAFTFSQSYIQSALAAQPHIVAKLVDLFHARFDPESCDGREKRVESLQAEIAALLENVASADEDRILRRFLNLIQSTLRTNFFQLTQSGSAKDYMSFKLDSQKVEDLPLPRPMVEIFVYSPRVEGVHLRGGKVARGGLRWSDRREDFRTEILGLIKAQMVKNSVIVPTGSKGGFVVKNPPADRAAFQAEGIECYRLFISGLLDITDNLVLGKVAPPDRVVRHDADDPYLVVAADKGTASFSDIANSVSERYGFWLGDAFASGGSQGYDHKVMGITARGAWESVKRHFREMGHDSQSQDFTAIAVGDMSGDVFGNGMLCSRHIRLIAAFNHLHIFIDPNPDAAVTYAERERLFREVKGWTDYDTSLISPGGGIFRRDAKRIQVSPQMADLFGITEAEITPAALIKILLKAQVDLLFFGGIGTYVKASNETHTDVGDRANDAIRVDGNEVKARVIGEGANLGMTQKGRIEFARSGGRINTDAIDNSGGVDCSDHEVNIKILLNDVVASGDLTMKQRNEMLAAMTDDVSRLVLRDNYLQSQAISLIEAEAPDLLDAQSRLMRVLEKTARLDRAVEFLPDDAALGERASARQGLTRPELAVLLAYSKVWMKNEILTSDLPEEAALVEDLHHYFPSLLQERFLSQIDAHRLRREIITTHVANSMINRVGPSFVSEIMDRTGAHPAQIARAYIIVRDAFALRGVWQRIEELDGKIPAAAQYAMLTELNGLVERTTLWVLRHGKAPLSIAATIAEWSSTVAEFEKSLDRMVPDETARMIAQRQAAFEAQGVPSDLARAVSARTLLAALPDIMGLAAETGKSIIDAGRLYFLVEKRFDLAWLRDVADRLDKRTQWQKLAVSAMVEDLFSLQRDLTQKIAVAASGQPAEQAVLSWADSQGSKAERCDQLSAEFRSATSVDLAMLTVAVRHLRALAQS